MIKVAGYDVQDAVLTMPIVGAWHIECTVDADTGLETGELANIETGAGVLFGVIRRGGVAFERAEIQVVGGAGGLSRELPAKGYKNPTAKIIVNDILLESGESLSPTSDEVLLATLFPFWGRTLGSAGAALDALSDALSASWRVLDDGTIWIGIDTYPPATLAEDAEIISECRPIAQRSIADETFALRPGTSLDGVRIAQVVHRVSPFGARSEVYAPREDTAKVSDPIRSALTSFVNRIMRRVDYHALYPARVVAQSGTGLLDLQPDDPKMPPLQKVSLRTFAPDTLILVPPGGRVLVGFEAGNPKLPYASLWGEGTFTSVAIAGNSDAVALASRVQLLENWAASHTHPFVATGASSPTSVPTTPPNIGNYGSTKLLIGG